MNAGVVTPSDFWKLKPFEAWWLIEALEKKQNAAESVSDDFQTDWNAMYEELDEYQQELDEMNNG